MAANSIAKGNVLISVSMDQLTSGLNKAGMEVKDWGRKMTDRSGKDKGGFGGMLMGGVKGAGPILMATMAMEGAKGATELAASFTEKLIDISKQGDIAKAFGMTPEAFTGVAGVAKSVGEDTREFTESLVTMGKLGSDAAKGVGEVAGPAFEKLGLNAAEFIKLKPDEQFFKMFEALNKLGPGMDQTRLIMNAFGEDGGKWLLPLLAKTPDQLRKMAAGFAITGEEMRKATAASQAIAGLKNTFDRMFKDIAIEAAPFIQSFADGIKGLISDLKPVFDWIRRYFETYSMMVSIFWGGIKEGAMDAWAWIKENFAGAFDWVAGIPTIEETVIAFFRAIGIAAALTWDTFKQGVGIFAWVIGQFIKGIAVAIHAFEKLIDYAKKLPVGVRPMWVDLVPDMTGLKKDLLTTGESMAKWGSGAITNWGKSAEEFNSWLDRALAKARQTNKAIDEGKAETKSEMQNPTIDKTRLGAAMLRGSQEAYSTIVKNRFGATETDTHKKTEKNTKKTADNTGKTAENTLKMAEAMARIGSF